MSTALITQECLRVRLLPFLFVLSIVAYIDRINVGFAALQMQGLLGFNDEVYGLGAGIFFLGYLLFQIPSSRVLEGLGARRWIAFLLLAWGIVSASMLFIRGHGVFTCCGSCSASQKRDFSLE